MSQGIYFQQGVMEYNPRKLTYWLENPPEFLIRRYIFIHFFFRCHVISVFFWGVLCGEVCVSWAELFHVKSRSRLDKTLPCQVLQGGILGCPARKSGSMVYSLLINGVCWGYNPSQGWVFRLEPFEITQLVTENQMESNLDCLGFMLVFRKVHADDLVLTHFCSRLFFKLMGISNKKQQEKIVK